MEETSAADSGVDVITTKRLKVLRAKVILKVTDRQCLLPNSGYCLMIGVDYILAEKLMCRLY